MGLKTAIRRAILDHTKHKVVKVWGIPQKTKHLDGLETWFIEVLVKKPTVKTRKRGR